MKIARDQLVPELAKVPRSLIIPLGKTVESLLTILAETTSVAQARWISGFPHPSGANGHRARQFALNRDSLREQVVQRFSNPLNAVGDTTAALLPQNERSGT